MAIQEVSLRVLMTMLTRLLLALADVVAKVVLGDGFALNLLGLELLGGENFLTADFGFFGADFEVTLPVDRLEVERGAGVDPKIVLSSTMFFFFSPNLGDPVTLVLAALGELDVGGQLESESSDGASAKVDAFVGVSPVFFLR